MNTLRSLNIDVGATYGDYGPFTSRGYMLGEGTEGQSDEGTEGMVKGSRESDSGGSTWGKVPLKAERGTDERLLIPDYRFRTSDWGLEILLTAGA